MIFNKSCYGFNQGWYAIQWIFYMKRKLINFVLTVMKHKRDTVKLLTLCVFTLNFMPITLYNGITCVNKKKFNVNLKPTFLKTKKIEILLKRGGATVNLSHLWNVFLWNLEELSRVVYCFEVCATKISFIEK